MQTNEFQAKILWRQPFIIQTGSKSLQTVVLTYYCNRNTQNGVLQMCKRQALLLLKLACACSPSLPDDEAVDGPAAGRRHSASRHLPLRQGGHPSTSLCPLSLDQL